MAVRNNALQAIWAKREENEEVVWVAAGIPFADRHDGIAIPWKSKPNVLKTGDHVDVVVELDGSIKVGIWGEVLELVGEGGQWLAEPPDASWNLLFEKVR